MKKILFLLLTVVVCINICACSVQTEPPVHHDYYEKTYQLATPNQGENTTITITNNIFEFKSNQGGYTHGTVSERNNEIVLSAEDGSGSIFVFDKENDYTLRYNADKSSSLNIRHNIPYNSRFVKK